MAWICLFLQETHSTGFQLSHVGVPSGSPPAEHVTLGKSLGLGVLHQNAGTAALPRPPWVLVGVQRSRAHKALYRIDTQESVL